MSESYRPFDVVNDDCLDAMKRMADNSVDSIVTDPPYGINFMNKQWDCPGGMLGQMAKGKEQHGAFAYGGSHNRGYKDCDSAKFQEHMTPIFKEMLRVAKPGAHLLAFGGTRMWHRLACAIEDAGWEVRDTVAWCYGSGFPKSMDVHKALIKKLGDEASDEWKGWGTCLKPAYEPIVLARKPLDGTVADNVLKWGVGGLNIDDCRVGYESDDDKASARPQGKATSKVGALAGGMESDRVRTEFEVKDTPGRFPANLIHDGSEEVLECFPDSDKPSRPPKNANRDGEASANARYTEKGSTNFAAKPGMRRETTSPARFFYCAKASKKERGEGNTHPTVKPIELMKYLVKLVTPKGALVLDPFMGSGTTGVAALQVGCRFLGIEKEKNYFDIAERRLKDTKPEGEKVV